MLSSLPNELLAKLRTFDTPTICNALEIIDAKFRMTGFTTKPLVAPFPDHRWSAMPAP
jgi:hypothetical protein